LADLRRQLGVKRVCHIYCHISGHIKKETHKSAGQLGHKMSEMLCQTCVWTVPSRKKWKNQHIHKHTSHILANLGHPIHASGCVANVDISIADEVCGVNAGEADIANSVDNKSTIL
jgi:hypothetical protein